MKPIYAVSRVMNYLAMGLVLVLMMITVSDIFMRFVFNDPITGVAETAEFIMVVLVLGVAWCAVQGGHISVDLVMKHFPPRVQLLVDIVTLCLGMGIIALMAWQAAMETIWEFKFKYMASNVFLVPTFPFWGLYTFGCVLLFLVIVTLIIKKVKEVTVA